jgi:hypothetical protein
MRSLYRFSVVALLALIAFTASASVASAHSAFGHADPTRMADIDHVAYGPASATENCTGGPTIDGILLNECLVRSFVIGPDTKSITVWYTKNPVDKHNRSLNGLRKHGGDFTQIPGITSTTLVVATMSMYKWKMA